MKISLDHISKKFQRHWIFKEITFDFIAPGAYALLGANGSGKSTLMRVIAGMQAPSRGKVIYDVDGASIETNRIFEHLSYCAPGMEIVEEFTLREYFQFHFTFKKLQQGLTIGKLVELTGLSDAADKPIADYSSGMKQRVKLAQAIFSDTKILLLDEPCTNLDQAGVDQYRDWIGTYSKDRLIIIASNDVREYYFCKEQIELERYK